MSDATLIFGWHAVRTLLQRQPTRITQLMLQKGREDERTAQVLQLAVQYGVPHAMHPSSELDRVAAGAGHGSNHQGVIARLTPSETLGEGALDGLLDQLEKDRPGTPPLLLILDGVQDPHNLGACLRTADAAGVHAVIVPRDRAAGLSATVRKVASGAAEIVPLIQVVNLARTLKWLKERGIWLVGTDDTASSSLFASDLRGPLGVVMGAEGTGMRRLTREYCDSLLAIPMAGIVESLNVSVATGAVLFEAVRQRTAAIAQRT